MSVWGSTYQSNLSRVFILQKKIIRIISKVSFDSHTDVLFKEHGILKFFDIYFYQIGKFMYLFKKGLLPNYFRNMFTLASQLHSHYTRNCNLYYIPPCRTNIRNFSIRFQGPKFFNSLSPEIQNSESIRLFGNRLKQFLLSWLNIFFVELHTSSFLFFSFFFIFKIIHFNISSCPHNLYDVPYIVKKPIVHKPQASI